MSANGRHLDGCTCTRCQGFAPGNALSVRHGAYASPTKLAPRAQEVADVVRAGQPLYHPGDEVSIALLAQTLVRIERSAEALDRVDEAAANELQPYVVGQAQELGRLRDDHARWISLARKLASDLGLSPASRSSLGLKLAHAATLAPRTGERTDDVDLSKLETHERVELERLVEKATAPEVVESDA
jgi:hypothetical protein